MIISKESALKIHIIICLCCLCLFNAIEVSAFENTLAKTLATTSPIVNVNVENKHEVINDLLVMDPYFYLTNQDEEHFAQPLADRSAWTKKYFGGLPLTDKNLWIQVDFRVNQQTNKSLGLLIMMVASYDAYWDGKLLGSNGVVGHSINTESAGQIELGFQLNKGQLSVGKHTLSLKVSTHHNNTGNLIGSFYIFNGDYPRITQHSNRSAMLPLAMSGALLLLAVYCLFIYFGAIKHICYLLFSGLCFVVLVLFIVESWRGIWGYTYDWHILRLQSIYFLTSLVSILLTVFFTFFFRLPTLFKIAIIAINLLLQVVIFFTVSGYDSPSLLLILVGISTSLFPCIYAVFRKQQSAWLMLIAVMFFTVPLAINVRLYMEQYFFISFGILIGVMLYSLTQTMNTKQQQLIQSQLNAGRLELELVKRNLQPHFILNTLTAVEEWIEESPAMAVKFIDALADEFRLMAKISSLPLILLQDEIDMCNAHLNVMGYRSNTQLVLNANLTSVSNLLPPGVLLTLLENALSHNNYHMNSVIFTLEQTIEKDVCTLVFTGPNSAKTRDNRMINAGLGSKYIEARLRESFAEYWIFETKQESECTIVMLQFPLVFRQEIS